ncbi:MAG: sulfotransferase domain-containing protein [Chloroflexota bacterium]|nr:MAG: sulfotransferase domain-containing protein [Chloroflexota bacterium]
MLNRLATRAIEDLRYGVACRQYHATAAEPQKVLVNGSPKTGTTWMLRLTTSVPGYSGISGIPGHNFRGVIKRYREVMPGEVVHGHDRYSEELWELLQSNGIKVVLTMRDPRDQVVSRLFHIRREREHPWHDRLTNMGNDDAMMAIIEGRHLGSTEALPGTRDHVSLTVGWLEAGDKAHCVRYEDLKEDTSREFGEVLHYIGVAAREELIRAIVERNRFERLTTGRGFWRVGRKSGQQDANSFYRKGIVGDWRNFFNELHVKRFKELVGDTLIEWGYEQDLDWHV